VRIFPSRQWTAAICAVWLAAAAAAATFDPRVYLEDVKFLASPEMRGRGTGSPELERAAAYIEGQFREFGLQPAGGAYQQPFQVTTHARIGGNNRFRSSVNGQAETLAADDFIPLNLSASGKIAGGVVFAGYGITAPEYHYDDYAGLNVQGRIVLLLRHEPQEYDEKSVFAGRIYTQHAQLSSKAANARIHGAAAVIVVADRPNHRGDGDELEKFGTTVGLMDAGIPFVQVKAARVDAWFAAAGKNLDKLVEDVDRDLKPRSFAFPDGVAVEARTDVVREVKTVHNVAGYLPGTTGEYVVVGAHYDHLGLGEQFSMAPSLVGTVHPGADDNASGTAGMLELARWFTHQARQKRGILFLAFAGEELGLLGSSYYVGHPALPLDRAVAMINLDMIGRVREGKVFVGGAGTGTGLRPLLDELGPKYGLNLDFSDTTGYGSSDHTSFTTRQVPVLFFFTGLHEDYHKPSDTWDKIDAAGTVKLLSLVAEAAGALREAAERPVYVSVAQPAGAMGPAGSFAGSGYGAYFGSVPDFGESQVGLKLAGVTEGSPAAKAGLQGGDVLVEFDGKPIQNLYDFDSALRARRPGDAVQVKVRRGGRTVEARVVLKKRP
jgi:hypothetical protein